MCTHRVIVVALLAAIVGSGARAESAQTPVPGGVWGGKGIQLTVTAAGATIDYGCDTATIDERLLLSGSSGKFTARGTHSFGRGGPRHPDDRASKGHRARYEGTLNGSSMRLSVFLPDLDRRVGEFTLQLGQRAALERCG
jgi:hypothetical protein